MNQEVSPYFDDAYRNDPDLVAAVELFADDEENASTLVVVEIPDGVPHFIDVNDGVEYIAEEHRRWYPDD